MANVDKHRKYECLECGKVDGVMYWSNFEGDMLVSCKECGAFLQVYDRQMYHTGIPKEKKDD